MDLTKQQHKILVEALNILKLEVEDKALSRLDYVWTQPLKELKDKIQGRYEDIITLSALVEKYDVVLYSKLSDEDKAICKEKVCPDCQGDLEYQEADPSGRDCDIYYCPECCNNPDLDGKPHKEFLIWFYRRDARPEVKEI